MVSIGISIPYVTVFLCIILDQIHFLMRMIFLFHLKSKEPWSLIKTGQHCSETIVSSTRDSLADCKAYCMQNGAIRLTYFQTKLCLCCTADSALADAISTAEIYEAGGSFVFVNICIHISNINKKAQN